MLQTVFDFGTLRPGELPVSADLLGYALLALACVIAVVFLTFFRNRWDAAVTPVIIVAVAGIALLKVPADASIPLRVYGYGLMMVLGFVCGIYLARWRARRAGIHPDLMTYCGVLALVGGVVGARLAFVIEKWDSEFAGAPNLLAKMANISSGGLIYYGGVVLATIAVLGYLRLKRLPARRFLDILAASLMVGLAFGRAGCLVNGCCWGGPCRDDWSMAMRFPMYSKPLLVVGEQCGPFSPTTDSPSPVYSDQLTARAIELAHRGTPDSPDLLQAGKTPGLLNPDPRLVQRGTIRISPEEGGTKRSVSRLVLHAPRNLHGPLENDQTVTMVQSADEAMGAFKAAAGSDGKLNEAEFRAAVAKGDGLLRGSEHWDDAISVFDATPQDGQLSFDEAWLYLQARRAWLVKTFATDRTFDAAARRKASEYLQADLYVIAADSWSLPVKPAQLLGIINALLLAGLLMAFYRHRRREGQVFALLMILYPITRFVLESIRSDNPHNLLKFQLTHNQYTSLAVVVAGVVFWWVLTRLRPLAVSASEARDEAAGRKTETGH